MADKQPNREAAERLYKAVTSQNVELGDFDKFYNKLSEPDGTSRLISALDKNDIYIGNLDEVNSKLFGGVEPPKKKEPTALASQGEQNVFSSAFGAKQQAAIDATQKPTKDSLTGPQAASDYVVPKMPGADAPVSKTPTTKTPKGTGIVTGNNIVSQNVSLGENEINPDVRKVLEEVNLDPDVYNNDPTNPVLKQAVDALSAYTGIRADLYNPETLKRAIGEAKILKSMDALKVLSAEAGLTPEQAADRISDLAANKFLDKTGVELYKIDKVYRDALAKGASKEDIAKIRDDWEGARKNIINTLDEDIKYYQNSLLEGRDIKSGRTILPQEKQEWQLKLADLQNQYVGLFTSPDKLIKQAASDSPALMTALEDKLKGKTPNQKLKTIFDAKATRYYLLGKKLGIKPEDVISEDNLRFMTTEMGDKGLVEYSLDNIKNYMGIGDLDGEVTSNDRKEFADLHKWLKTTSQALLINKRPFDNETDSKWSIFGSEVAKVAPFLAAENLTGKEQADIISDALAASNIPTSELLPSSADALNTKLKDYGFGQSMAQMAGGTARIMLPALLGGQMVGVGMELLLLNPRTAALARFLAKDSAGKLIKGGLQYEAGGLVANDRSELDFGSGFVAEVAGLLPTPLKGAAPWLVKTFGKSVVKAGSPIVKALAAGGGEFVEETAQTIYQAWRDTPEGKTTLDTLKSQFGDIDDVTEFVLGTNIMGGGMNLASNAGYNSVVSDNYNKLTPDGKAVVDAVIADKKATDNKASVDAIADAIPNAKTEAIQDEVADFATAKAALQKILDSTSSDEDSAPYSITVNGMTFAGATPMELRADIDFIDSVSKISNEELYKRFTGAKTETPTIEEETVIGKPSEERGVDVEGEQPTTTTDRGAENTKLARGGESTSPDNAVLNKNAETGIELWHGGLPADFDIETLDVNRLAEKQQKRGRNYAGFYLYDETSKGGAETYSKQTGRGLHRFIIDKGANILELGNIERVSQEQLAKYREQGYDLLKGTDVRGRTEYILLNKDVVREVTEASISKAEEKGTANTEIGIDIERQVADLRAEERAELAEAIPSIEEYKVDGKVVEEKITDPADKAKYQEIYDRYDKLITPLLNEQTPAESIGAAKADTGKVANAGESKAGEIDDDAFFAGKIVPLKKVTKAQIEAADTIEVDLDEVMSLFEDTEYQDRYDRAVDEENNRIAAQVTDELTFDTGTQGVLSVKEAAINAAFKRVDPDSFRRFGDSKNLKGKKFDKTNQVLNLQFLLKKGGKTIDQIAQEATGKLSKDFTDAITTDDVYEYMMSRAENPKRFRNKFQKAADVVRKGKIGKDGVAMSGVIPPPIWNATIEGVARAIEYTGDIAKATAMGIAYIKQTDWYKGATPKEQQQAITDVKKHVADSVPQEAEETVTDQMLDDVIAGGFKRDRALDKIADIDPTLANTLRVGSRAIDTAYRTLINKDGAFDKELATLEKKLGIKKIC